MSKKNRRKTLPKEDRIVKSKFSIDDSKMYIIVTIVMFHIVPLFFVMMGENGQMLLLQFFLMMLNPMCITLTALIYGIKKGFNWKLPLFIAILAFVSVPMYYEFDSAAYRMQTTVIMAIVYTLFAYISAVIGGFVKNILKL